MGIINGLIVDGDIVTVWTLMANKRLLKYRDKINHFSRARWMMNSRTTTHKVNAINYMYLLKIWCICLLLQYILMAYYTLKMKIKTNISFMITMIKWQVNTNTVREFSNIKTPLPRTWHTCYHNNSKRPYFVNKLFVVFHVLLFIHIVSILSVLSTHFTPISHNTPEGSGRQKTRHTWIVEEDSSISRV